MHRFPKIFTNNKSKTMKPKPKLDRRNAAKNINYDCSPSTSASTSSSSSTSSHEDSLRTRSLELYGNKTSFRIDGSVEGEVELLCKTLGFSGIEDFAIPEEEYAAAMKLRTSSAPLLDREIDFYDRSSDDAMISTSCDTLCFNNDVNKRVNNGIKGVRPPPLVDKEYCSSSDLFRGNSDSVRRSFSRFRVDGNEGVVEEGSCSFTTSSNDDSSSTTTPMSSNSPSRRFRRDIVDWQKGELLGSGSFGSVYEGISVDGFFFAVKEVSLLDQDNDGKQRILQLEQEIALLSRFEHENIVQYYGTAKILIDSEQRIDGSADGSLRIEDEMPRSLAGEGKLPEPATAHSAVPLLLCRNDDAMRTSYMHPFIYCKLTQEKNCAYGDTESSSSGVRRNSQLEASTSSGPCCNNYNWISKPKGVHLNQLVNEGNLDMLKLSPSDEIEGELIYYQQRILSNAVQRKRLTDDLISKVAKSLPEEIDAAGREKWNAVLVSQYNNELREAIKKGRKERRHKEAQAVLAAATAAVAASSRSRKDALDESASQEEPIKVNLTPGVYSQLSSQVKNTFPRSMNVSKDRPRICEICVRGETILNPVLVCSSCKVAVHLDCYRSVKSTMGPWHCELCEDLLLSSEGSEFLSTEKPYVVAECGLCGGTANAFRKSVDGQWIHALCAEWVLESKYRRGQVNPIGGMDSVGRGNQTCSVCCRKKGVCLKCSYGQCQSTFHPTCGRSAGFYMTMKTGGGKLQHKAYCEKHSSEQRTKADTQKHGIEEFKRLKQIRVELERLRLLCERIIKREKLKRELVLCSHEILASNRDSVLSALSRHPFYQPEISSESATTSIKVYSHLSGSEMVQRSDDITIDSAVAGKRRVKFPVSTENDHRTVDSSASPNVYTLKKSTERPSLSGKQIQRASVAPLNLSSDLETRSMYKKGLQHTEILEKELVMTSDQASMKNQRLPKGFVYVPIRSLSKEDKDKVPDSSGK